MTDETREEPSPNENKAELEKQYNQLRAECIYMQKVLAEIALTGKVWMCPFCNHCKSTFMGIADCDIAGKCKMPFSEFRLRIPE